MYINSINIALFLIQLYRKGNIPENKTINLDSKYHGCSGILFGTGLTLQGFLITFFFNPIKEPIRTKGD